MPLLALSTEETEALAALKDLETQHGKAVREYRKTLGGYGHRDDEDNEAKAKVERLKAEYEAMEESPLVLSAVVKAKLNEMAEEAIPGGSLSPYIGIAETLEASLDGPDGERVKTLLKKIAIRGINMVGDPDINAARANVLRTRYDALKATGLPDAFVKQIILAEQSRPINFPSGGSGSRK